MSRVQLLRKLVFTLHTFIYSSIYCFCMLMVFLLEQRNEVETRRKGIVYPCLYFGGRILLGGARSWLVKWPHCIFSGQFCKQYLYTYNQAYPDSVNKTLSWFHSWQGTWRQQRSWNPHLKRTLFLVITDLGTFKQVKREMSFLIMLVSHLSKEQSLPQYYTMGTKFHQVQVTG